jgi:hypothetical protein
VQPEYLTETFHKLTVYLAGPMTGIPQFNYPKFHRIAKELRDAGYNVISPVEEDTQEYQTQAMASKDGLHGADGKFAGLTWGDILSKDVKLVADKVDGVVVMDGWEKSRGARLEVFVANLSGRTISVYEGSGKLRPMGEGEYLKGITAANAVLTGGSDYGRN